MKSYLLKSTILAGSALAIVAVASPADASHFRGAAMVPSVASNGVLTVTTTSFWRPTAVSDLDPITIAGIGSVGSTTSVTDTSDARFTKVTETFTATLTGAGTYAISQSNCCRVAGINNANQSTWTMNSSIFWDGSSSNTPILFDFSTIQPEVVRGANQAKSLGAAAGNGGTLSFNQTLNQNINSVMPGQSINAATGVISIDGTMTGALPDNPTGNIGADYAFSGNIVNSDGSFVEFDWLWDLVDQGTANLAPVVEDKTFNILAGQSVNTTIMGTDNVDSVADNVTLSLGTILGGPALAPSFTPGAPGDPTSGSFMWDSTGSAIGTYIFNINGTDGVLTDIGQITVNVLRQVTVPEPAALGLFGLGLLGLGVAARRRRTR